VYMGDKSSYSEILKCDLDFFFVLGGKGQVAGERQLVSSGSWYRQGVPASDLSDISFVAGCTARRFIRHVAAVVSAVADLGGENTARGSRAGVGVRATGGWGSGSGQQNEHQQGEERGEWEHDIVLATLRPSSHRL